MLRDRTFLNSIKNVKLETLLSVILVTATIVFYSQVLLNGFINYDDPHYVTENPYVQQGLTIEGVLWAFKSFDASNWHPLTWLTHMLDVQMFGMSPMGHHLTNLLLHGANTLLLFLFLVSTTSDTWQSFFAALLFGIHPFHVESVAWISERKDLLCGLFWMLTILAYARYAATRRMVYYFSAIGFFVAALMSKPMAVTLPFVLLLLDYWPLHRSPQQLDHNPKDSGSCKHIYTNGVILEKLPFFFLAGAVSLITVIAQGRGGSIKEVAGWSEPVMNALAGYVTYLVKTVWPGHLVVLYPYSPQPIWKAFSSVIVLIGISALLGIWRTRRYLLTGWLWYLITLFPVSGIVKIGEHSIADRYMYLPIAGLFIAITWGIEELIKNGRIVKKVALTVGAAIILFFSVKTWDQILYWRDSVSLFQHAIHFTSDNWMACHNLGNAYLERGETQTGLKWIQKSIQINPANSIAYNSLATAYGRLGREDEAIAAFKEALRLDPGLADARFNLIRAYFQKGDKKAAFDEYRILLKSNQELAGQLAPYFKEGGT